MTVGALCFVGRRAADQILTIEIMYEITGFGLERIRLDPIVDIKPDLRRIENRGRTLDTTKSVNRQELVSDKFWSRVQM